MKKLLAVILVVMMLVPTVFAEEDVSVPRVLVAYPSRSGENYNVGVPREGSASAAYAGYIEKGNTAILAETIAEATGGDLFAITTVIPYPDDYATMLQVAQEEIATDARPELAGTVENMDDYDVVFIGYPIWHGHLPQAIFTFMESYDFSGKTVIPFNTHEGSGQSGTQLVIENALPDSTGGKFRKGIKAAVFVGETLIRLQKLPVDLAMYYDAQVMLISYCGLFNEYTRAPEKPFYAMLAFNKVKQFGFPIESSDGDGVFTLASASDNGYALMITNFNGEQKKVTVHADAKTANIYTLNAASNLELTNTLSGNFELIVEPNTLIYAEFSK